MRAKFRDLFNRNTREALERAGSQIAAVGAAGAKKAQNVLRQLALPSRSGPVVISIRLPDRPATAPIVTVPAQVVPQVPTVLAPIPKIPAPVPRVPRLPFEREKTMSFNAIKSTEDFFHKAIGDAELLGKWLVAHQAQIDADTKIGVAIVSALDPAVAPIASLIGDAERSVLATIISAVHTSGAAAAKKGLTTTFDANFVASVESLTQLIEKVNPGSTKPPAGLTSSTVASIAA